MKKRIAFFALLLVAAISMQAQSIVGTWKAPTETDKDGTKQTLSVVFNQGTKCALEMVMESKDAEMGTFVFQMDIPGTYTKNGNKLTVNLDVKKCNGRIVKIDWTKEVADAFKQNPSLEATIMNELHKTIDSEMKKSFAKEPPIGGDLKITKLTATDLVLDDEGDVIQFKRAQ